MWDFFETVRHRHSVRKFRPDPVEREKVHAILEMASAAPSAGDLQSYRIVAVQDPARRQTLVGAAPDQPFLNEAPLCLVFAADRERAAGRFGERGRQLYAVQDATIAAAYAQLAIVAAGLASTWVGEFDAEAVRQAAELPPGLEPLAMLAVGYPAELPAPTPRRHLGDVVSFL